MCGIAGILSIAGAPPEERELAAMIETLRYRGPDGTGFYRDHEVGLAHARLSIIDLEGGASRSTTKTRRSGSRSTARSSTTSSCGATWNGRGHRFYTQSDTEVIVHLYEEYGDSFVEHLNGQFAIALWDQRRRRLVLARDRTGIRPLFYTTAAGRLLFASEIKALLACPEVPRRLDPRAWVRSVTFWSALPPDTVFEGIETLPPGHYMVVEGGGSRLVRYWDWAFPEEPMSDARSAEACAEELRALLVDAVRLQLRADVPVGAYLSGGLDSSIVTTIIKNFTDTPLRTFSLTFEDGEFDESAHQQQLVSYLGTRHTAVHCTHRGHRRGVPDARSGTPRRRSFAPRRRR